MFQSGYRWGRTCTCPLPVGNAHRDQSGLVALLGGPPGEWKMGTDRLWNSRKLNFWSADLLVLLYFFSVKVFEVWKRKSSLQWLEHSERMMLSSSERWCLVAPNPPATTEMMINLIIHGSIWCAHIKAIHRLPVSPLTFRDITRPVHIQIAVSNRFYTDNQSINHRITTEKNWDYQRPDESTLTIRPEPPD